MQNLTNPSTETLPALKPPTIPEGWNLRVNQKMAIERAEAAFKSGKKIVAIEGPTGSGKSLIGVVIASMFKKAFYSVPLKALQDQIWDDFGKDESIDMAIFKGKANYLCNNYAEENPGMTVDAAPCQEWGGADQRKHCRENKICSYFLAQDKARDAHLTLLNFVLYLAWMRIADKHPNPPIYRRDLHIIDEAHKIENVIRDFLTISISARQLSKHFGTSGFPDHLDEHAPEEEYIEFLTELQKRNDVALANLRNTFNAKSNDELRIKASDSDGVKDMCQFHLSLEEKLEIFLKNPEDYGFGFERKYHSHEKDFVSYVVVKPALVASYMREYVLGENTLLLSATLPKQKLLSMGFKEEEIEYIEMPSTFPVENRPIIFKNLGTLNMKSIDGLMPRLTQEAIKIMRENKAHKGIIHAPSYRVAEILEQSIKKDCPDSGTRLLLQPRETGGAMKILEQHQRLDFPTVLLSPGMKEGIDLKDGLARFQIILKCPYPSLGDPIVKKLSEQDHLWYITETLIDFYQMYGRSVRNETDWAKTYVFDNHMRALLVRHRKIVPKYILEACKWVG